MALFWRQIATGISANNATSDEIGTVDVANVNELTFYVVAGAGVASGGVTIEEAHVAGYTGAWAIIGAAVTPLTASIVKTLKVSGVSQVVRARVSTVVVGGTVDVYVLGR